jgi:hypothetical protein
VLKWSGHVVGTEDNRWPRRIMTWLPEERWRRGRPDGRWEEEVKMIMKQRNLTSGNIVNWQLWQLKASNRWNAGKTDTYLLTPWSRVLLENRTGFQLVKQFLAFYGTRKFITTCTSARHLFLSWAGSIQSIPHIPLPEDPC